MTHDELMFKLAETQRACDLVKSIHEQKKTVLSNLQERFCMVHPTLVNHMMKYGRKKYRTSFSSQQVWSELVDSMKRDGYEDIKMQVAIDPIDNYAKATLAGSIIANDVSLQISRSEDVEVCIAKQASASADFNRSVMAVSKVLQPMLDALREVDETRVKYNKLKQDVQQLKQSVESMNEIKAEKEASIQRFRWITAYGSERLKHCLQLNLDIDEVYVEERLKLERPGWYITDIEYEDVNAANISADIVKKAVDIITAYPGAKLMMNVAYVIVDTFLGRDIACSI